MELHIFDDFITSEGRGLNYIQGVLEIILLAQLHQYIVLSVSGREIKNLNGSMGACKTHQEGYSIAKQV